MTPPPRKKLIEVSMPLEAINVASAREKSIRHGHPSTLHLWWARRPLAACRAVIFGQLVDDPSAWPDRFTTEAARDAERERLHGVIAEMVEWPKSTPADQARWERALGAARYEIARSLAWGRGEEPPKGRSAVLAYLAEQAPPVYDPFCGGGSIPLEAQRLGLKAYGSDLNPVAVLISKALVEIPPKFAGMAPVHPQADDDLITEPWRGSRGLAEDVRWYGRWMRDEARRRIGSLYPEATLPDGRKAMVIAWLWARTVRSPDPAAKGAMVPLASTFVLSSKVGKEAIVRVVRDPAAPDGWRFEVQQGAVSEADLATAKDGTKGARANFSCVISGAPISPNYIRVEGQAGRLSTRLMAIVVEGNRRRDYLPPTEAQQLAAGSADAFVAGGGVVSRLARETFLSGPTPAKLTGGTCHIYGLDTWGRLFTDRQLVALTTFSDLVGEARERARADAEAAFHARGSAVDPAPLSEGGCGPAAYADAVATYLALAVDRSVMAGNTLVRWNNVGEKAQHCFGRQALPMIWDFAEPNFFAGATGGFSSSYEMAVNALAASPSTRGVIEDVNAPENGYPVKPTAISTDPPYYDNVGYADLSDFFYVWLRRSLGEVWPHLFRRLQTPKDEELVAAAYRHGGKDAAEAHFMTGMTRALAAMCKASVSNIPLTIYYAFKQSEKSQDGVSSPGWNSFLQGVIGSGLMMDGTWPIRTEMATRMVASDTNALASSIVLVCRPRPTEAPTTTRRDFVAELRRELPDALARMRADGVHPVDIPQSALGPGMAVFSRYAVVREADDSAMSVGRAIALINQVRGEIDHAESGDLDAPTRFALDWFAAWGWGEKDSGEAIKLAGSYDLTDRGLITAGVLTTKGGQARLTRRDEMPLDWRPSSDRTLTAWELAQALNRALNDGGGVNAAGSLLAEARGVAADARWLTQRLFAIAEDRRLTDEARGWGRLSEAWEAIEAAANRGAAPVAARTGELF